MLRKFRMTLTHRFCHTVAISGDLHTDRSGYA